jgi:hypothetical protein
MAKKELTLDDYVPVGDVPVFEDTTDWTRDERAAVKLAAQAIDADANLTLEEKFEFIFALVTKPLKRGHS